MSKRRKKIVCFAGGSVVPKIILEPLKSLAVDLVGITSMVDNGGSTGVLRKELNVLPPGDIRRHLLALSEAEDWKKKLWEFRFAQGTEMSPHHYGHNFANIFIGGLEYILGDFRKVLKIVHEYLQVKGKALPATLDKVQLVAELENGRKIKGEDEIDIGGRKSGRSAKIKKVYLEPRGRAYSGAVAEIKSADWLIIGPGDFYSSIVPCFLPQGMKGAIRRSKSKKIFICPLMTKRGETSGFTVRDFCEKTEEYIGAPLDFVIYNNFYPAKGRVDQYKRQTDLLDKLLVAEEDLDDQKFIGANLILDKGEIKHDKRKLLRVLRKIIKI
jgi:uncharacterized cofD-like protein